MIIYKAVNLINNKIYIGQTINSLEYRKNQHFRDSVSENRRKTNYFHNAIYKYGKDNFVFEVIDSADNEKELNEKEQYWIAHYKSNIKDYGYNLDSGGKSGGRKSEATKEKIGLSTLEKWANPQIAEKMLSGLRKGTEVVKEKAKDNFVTFVCPVCNKSYKMKQWEANYRKTCSLKCAAQINYDKNVEHLKIISEMNHQTKLNERNKIGEFIINWAKNNKDVVLNCPLNNITTQLKPLMTEIEEKYHIKDMRSVMLCFDLTSRKDFVLYLQNLIKQ